MSETGVRHVVDEATNPQHPRPHVRRTSSPSLSTEIDGLVLRTGIPTMMPGATEWKKALLPWALAHGFGEIIHSLGEATAMTRPCLTVAPPGLVLLGGSPWAKAHGRELAATPWLSRNNLPQT